MQTLSLLKKIARSLLLSLLVTCPLLAQGDYGYVLTGSYYSIYPINLKTRTLGTAISPSVNSNTGTLNARGTKLWVTSGSGFYVVNTLTKAVEYRSSSMSVSKPVFSPDGSKAYLLLYGSPTTLLVVDTAGYVISNSVQLTGTYYWRSTPVLSKDGTKLFFLDENSYINQVDMATYAVKRTYISSSSYATMKLSPDDSLLFVYPTNMTYSNTIQAYRASTLASVTSFNANNYVNNLTFSKDGKTMYVGLSSSMVQKIDISSFPSMTSTNLTLPNTCYDLAVDPSDTLLYVMNSSYSSNINIINLKTGAVTGTLSTNSSPTALIMPLAKDTVAPASVANLTASVLAYNAIRLVFTAPGDDGSLGQASFYDVRYDTVQIADSTFKRAKKVPGIGWPHAGGKKDTIDVTGLTGSKTYYFAIKVGDEVLNVSPLATTSIATPAPSRLLYQLEPITRAVKDNDSVALALKIQNGGDADLSYNLSLFGIEQPEIAAAARAAAGHQSGSVLASVGERKSAATGVRALIVSSASSSSVYDVQQKLLSQGGFSQIDLYPTGSSSTPTIDQLKQYDVVFVWTSGYYYIDPVALGNVLADFVDEGGSVVTALLAPTTSSSSGVLGRFMTDNYWAITPGSMVSGPRATLGVVKSPNHPIMRGVKTFDGGSSSSTGYGSYRIPGGGISSGATLIASWSDGAALVAVKRFKKTTRVDLGFYPPSSDMSSEYWVSSTDGAKLMANALKYAATSGSYVDNGEMTVSFSSDSGIVKKGEIKTVTVVLKTKNTTPGDYTMTLALDSNDPDSLFATMESKYTVRDLTPPALGIRFFQNEAFPQNVSIVSVAHEKLYSAVMKAGIDGDSVEQALALIDTSNFVYNTDYKLTKSGTLSVRYQASDSIGNRSVTTRSLAVQNVSSSASARIASPDNRASMRLQPGAGVDPVFVTAAVDEEQTKADCMGPVYRFSPQSLALASPADLSIGFAGMAGGEACGHFGIYAKAVNGEWVYVPTRLDAKGQTVHAHVSALGEFRIMNNPSIQPEEYVETLPSVFALEQNYPNPFNPSTTIRYQLPEPGLVRLAIFDAIGREVATLVNEVKPAGYYTVEFNGARLSSGVYFARLSSGQKMEMKKLVLMK